MKKLFTFALAAATLVGFSACSNDEENALSDKGYINLNVTADQIVATRAAVDAPVAEWYALVTNSDGTPVFGTTASKDLIGTALASTKLTAGQYKVAVSNYANEAGWKAANSGYGNAYFTGSYYDATTETDYVTVVAGTTKNISIACGKAQNARFSIASGGFAGSALTVTANDATNNRSLTFSKAAGTISNVAYYDASVTLALKIEYTINNKSNTLNKNLTLGGAGTNNTLTISSDQNGYISVSITYDSDYAEGGQTQTIEIDSSTGGEKQN